MNLPGSPRMHVWLGLFVSLVGVLVGGYAYTGDRIYRLTFLPVALVGLALVLAGSALAGYGQANRPRMAPRPSEEEEPTLRERIAGLFGSSDDEEAPEEQAQAGAEVDEASDTDTSLAQRLTASAQALVARVKPEDEDEPDDEKVQEEQTAQEAENPQETVEAQLECPNCQTRFEATGRPPFEAECPSCQHTDTVDPTAGRQS